MPNHLSQKLKIGVGWPSAVLLSVYIDEMVLFQGFLNVEIPVMPAVAAVDLPRDDYFRCPFDGWSQVPLTRVQVLQQLIPTPHLVEDGLELDTVCPVDIPPQRRDRWRQQQRDLQGGGDRVVVAGQRGWTLQEAPGGQATGTSFSTAARCQPVGLGLVGKTHCSTGWWALKSPA